jgi:hypothetical protein
MPDSLFVEKREVMSLRFHSDIEGSGVTRKALADVWRGINVLERAIGNGTQDYCLKRVRRTPQF